ncbi:syntaxin-binding protein 4-like [Pleurodeles waltl]|uniref:syntaxin-binding protein 4-like n=1 Tax=Pleurodeles waltl TaxID=8319 RepID=UPI0037095BBA
MVLEVDILQGLCLCRQEIHFPAPCPSPDICRPEVTVSGPTSPGFQTTAASQTKVNLDPHIRLKEEKLELVLQYLGLDVSEGKRRELRHCLVPDLQGTVTFGDVVQVFREILQDDLEEAGLDETSFLFTHHQVATLLDTSTFHSSTFESFNYTESSIAQHRNQEVSDLQQEIYRLKVRLKDAESRKEVMEEELQKLNQGVNLSEFYVASFYWDLS